MRHVRHDYVDEEEYPVTRRDEKEKQYYQEQGETKYQKQKLESLHEMSADGSVLLAADWQVQANGMRLHPRCVVR